MEVFAKAGGHERVAPIVMGASDLTPQAFQIPARKLQNSEADTVETWGI